MYDDLKEYVVEKEFENNGKKHVFYRVKEEEIIYAESRTTYRLDYIHQVKEEEIIYAESRMKIDFPKELREFLSQIGYGYFYDKDECFIDLLMNPKRIADFRCGEGDYFYAEEREFLKSEDLVFFEVDSNCHICLKIGGEDEGKVFLGKRRIAQSFGEFIGKISIESNYFFEKSS